MAELLPQLRQQFLDANGDPLAGGFLYCFLATTSTPAATYTDQSGETPNENPIELDANGAAYVWIGDGAYKFILTDADDVEQFSIDNVTVPGTEDTPSLWAEHAVTDGQAATSLAGETVNFALYSSAIYDVEIIRGTTVISCGQLAVQNLNGTARVMTGLFMADEQHGVTFSVTQSVVALEIIAQLKAALDTGAGNGTIKLSRRLVPA